MNTAPPATAPEIAILGHPNEGKSSVLSTLAEDDSVRVSATPGETVICRTFPVQIDGREVLRFTDTPGFQNPSRVLAELEKLSAQKEDCIELFREKFKNSLELHDDVELLLPVERGAGIIYVVDGSRPLRNVDRAEMEILRLSGRPRMAIINCKEDSQQYLEDWKSEFRKSFNAIRMFNAHRATYAERILLLETLKSIDQDWQHIIDRVVNVFKSDWESRNRQTTDILLDLFSECLQHSVSAPLSKYGNEEQLQTELLSKYQNSITDKEKLAHGRIRALFKHNIFDYNLPPQSLLNDDLFSEKVWELFGLSRTQLAIIGGLSGAAIGAGIDIAAAGLAFGVFTGISGAVGAATALWGGKKLSQNGLLGVPVGGEQLRVGPTRDINLLFVLINRALLFYKHTINWAHGRRDYETVRNESGLLVSAESYTSNWSTKELRACHRFFTALTKNGGSYPLEERNNLAVILSDTLNSISKAE